ncbi:MAG: AI-2E family transporter, partial [Spirochaetales bacterium]|nr:AI-2E family transporter [Spirochaetales bacterium]
MDSNHTEGLKIQRVVFLALFGALFVLVARLFKPFFSILLWASLVYGISLPLFRRSTTTKAGLERNKAWQTVMAVTFSVGSLFLIVVPLTLLVLALAGQVQDLVDITLAFIERGETFMHSDGFASLAAKLTELSGGLVDLHAIDVADQLASMIGAYGERIIGITAELVRNVTGFIVTLAFFVFVLFFLYLDGRELLMTLIDAIPLRNAYTIRFMRKFRDTGKDL